MKRIRRIRIWLWAYFDTHKLWRVTYTAGGRTRLLHKVEAENLAAIFTGTIWIDYKRGEELLKN